MVRFKFLALAALSFIFMLSGCVARTYQATKERVDQELIAGNRGYLSGKAPAIEEGASRKTTREVRVVEIELGKSHKSKKAKTVGTPASRLEEETTAPAMTEEVSSGEMQQYTVGKSDTLQKISKKFYGTTKKWYKIYKANKDTLSGPDKIYPGQVINVPVESGVESAAGETLKEVPENMK